MKDPNRTAASRIATRRIPDGYTERSDDQSSAVAYIKADGLAAIGFRGTRQAYDWWFKFRLPEHREEKIAAHFAAVRELEASRRANRHPLKPHTLKVGEILNYRWGYDQVNIDFFEVAQASEHTVKIRSVENLACKSDGKFDLLALAMSGHVVPDLSKPRGESLITKRVLVERNGEPYLRMVHGCARRWDGRPCFCSWDA